MRKLVITQNVTVDGAVDMLDGWFDPAVQMDDLAEEMRRQDSQADAVLLGRKTFVEFRDYWRDLSDDTTGVTEYLNRVDKYVVSSTLEDPEWDSSTILRGDPVEQVRSLKERQGRDIVLTGSISLAHALIAADLVDEYRFFGYPAAQARGRRLFPHGCEPARLSLLGTSTFGGQIVLTRYAVQR